MRRYVPCAVVFIFMSSSRESFFGRLPVPSAAARMKALRQRARNGKAIVSLEIDLLPVTELLIDKGLLPITGAEDRGAIGHALEKLLALLIAARSLPPACDA